MSSSDTVIQLEDLEKIYKPLRGDKPNTYKYICYDFEEKPENIVSFGNHSLLQGLITAYENHKSITLSPDIIWLLIVQGFSYHVAENKEELRSMFVSFENR